MRVHLLWLCLPLCLGLLLLEGGCKSKKRSPVTDTAPAEEPAPPSTPSAPPSKVVPPAQAQAEKDPNSGLSGLMRVWNEQELKNRLKNLGLAYHNYFNTNNKAPTKVSDLAEYYGNDAAITEALEKDWIHFYYKVTPLQMREGSSNTILAYETEPDRLGFRWILKGDGSIDKVGPADFDKMPKAGK